MELRCLAVVLGLCLLAISQCSEARHAMERRDVNDDDIFAADEASEDEGTQNDFDERNGEVDDKPAIQANITTLPTTYEVTEGQDVRLECNVDPDNGTVVQWFKNNTLIFIGGINIGKNDRYSMVHDSKDLIITQVQSSDGGVYRCEVPQEADPPKVQHIVIVLESPGIARFTATNNGNVVEGADLLLTCDARGKPAPKIVWSRSTVANENQRLNEKDGEFSANSIYMKNIKREHSGKYYCYAFNSIGSSQAELRINVAGNPRVHVHRTIVNSAINVEAVLECSVHYEDNPHIRWYKDSVLISDSSSQYIVSTRGEHSNLTVTPTTDNDFGTFTCEATNDFGKHVKSIELVQKPVIESLSSVSGKLTWTVHSHQPLQEIIIQTHKLGDDGEWMQISVPLPSTQHHKYQMVHDLREQMDVGKYEAIVKVKNDHSWSDAGNSVVVDIEIEPELIQHASVFRGDGNGQNAIRPSSVILSSMMMYVLVRWF